MYVDGVHHAAHAAPDLTALGADFLVCSPYKFFGPHCAALVADPALLETLRPDKLLPSTDVVPERFELGTLPYEMLAGATAAVDFLADLAPDGGSRRERLVAAYALIQDHELRLRPAHRGGLAALGDHVTSTHAPPTARRRCSSPSATRATAVDAYDALAKRDVLVPAGTFYAYETFRALRLSVDAGLRIGLAAYNDDAEVDRLPRGADGPRRLTRDRSVRLVVALGLLGDLLRPRSGLVGAGVQDVGVDRVADGRVARGHRVEGRLPLLVADPPSGAGEHGLLRVLGIGVRSGAVVAGHVLDRTPRWRDGHARREGCWVVPEIRDASTDDDVRVEAWDAGVLVGHASARPVQLFHDERFCSVEVVPDRRREGIGSTLYAAVDALVPPRSALICRVLHPTTAESGFVESIGYELIELCPAPIADPSDTAWRRWVADQPLPAGAQTVRIDAVSEVDLESPPSSTTTCGPTR